jgi:hypothetical protein
MPSHDGMRHVVVIFTTWSCEADARTQRCACDAECRLQGWGSASGIELRKNSEEITEREMRLERRSIGECRQRKGRNQTAAQIIQRSMVAGVTVVRRCAAALFHNRLRAVIRDRMARVTSVRVRQCEMLREQQQERKAQVGKKTQFH